MSVLAYGVAGMLSGLTRRCGEIWRWQSRMDRRSGHRDAILQRVRMQKGKMYVLYPGVNRPLGDNTLFPVISCNFNTPAGSNT